MPSFMGALTPMLTFSIFSAVLGMFQFGYNTGVINAPQTVVEQFIADVYKSRNQAEISSNLLSFLWSLTVSIFAVGGMIGGISGGTVANFAGRKLGLLLNNAVAILAAFLMFTSDWFRSPECLIAGRFFIGVNCGLNTALVPMYLSEIAPVALRGALGTVNQLAVTVGLLLAQVFGLEQVLGSEKGWPYLLGLAIVPAVLQLVLLPFCPESPRHLLITKGKLAESTASLQRLRSNTDVAGEIAEMEAEDRAQRSEARVSMLGLFRTPSLRMPLLIGVIMQLSQQLSGINAVFYYSTNIFTSASLSSDAAKIASVGVGIIMVVMTFIGVTLVDRLGRRTLHLTGLGGMAVMSIAMTIFFLVNQDKKAALSYLLVTSTFIYVVFFAIGPGSIPWMITAELFSQGPRPAAMSIAVLVNWLANFAVGLLFPLMQTVMTDYSFLPFTACLIAFWLFTYFKVPETKGRTFEEISAIFRTDERPGERPPGYGTSNGQPKE